jgi:HEAT repeat protein
MSRLLPATLLLLLTVVPVLAHASDPSVTRAPPPGHGPNRAPELDSPSRDAQTGALLTLLRAPHPQVDGFHLRRIGPDVNTLLVEFATAPGPDMQIRLRALAWLEHFPSHQSRQVLLETLRASDSAVPTRRVCLRALAYAFGSEMLPVVRDHLQDRNLYIREAAAYALGDIDDRRVRDILTDHMGRERELTVRDAALASLRRVAEREARR